MFIAMNRFQVRTGDESAFEARWLERDSHLRAVPGFIEFHLLRGPEHEGYVLYASHTLWQERAEFEAWTRSEAFRGASRCRPRPFADHFPSRVRRIRSVADRHANGRVIVANQCVRQHPTHGPAPMPSPGCDEPGRSRHNPNPSTTRDRVDDVPDSLVETRFLGQVGGGRQATAKYE
jgi:heme-degrading monooxygenase HmoA